MSRKPLIGLSFSLAVLLLLGGLYTNCQPLGETMNYGSGDGASQNPEDEFTLPPPGAPLSKGQDLWVNTLEPMMRATCVGCHALPFQGGTATINIYSYQIMKPLAQPGPTSSNNPFMNKVKNIIAHEGGDQCLGDVNGTISPCKEIKEWIVAEYPLLSDGKAGVVKNTDLLGRISGWVADPLNINLKADATFYLNAPVGVGINVGTQVAELPGIGAITNGHYFNFQLPALYRDGVERDLYVYASTQNVAPVEDDEIPLMPVKTQGFIPGVVGDAGRDIYESDVRPRLNACTGCHQVDYSVHFFTAGTPTPLAGATSTNNELINYMNGQNGHSGGSFCGGNKNNEPCASVQRWWASEFGP